jgi:hypothetical protein
MRRVMTFGRAGAYSIPATYANTRSAHITIPNRPFRPLSSLLQSAVSSAFLSASYRTPTPKCWLLFGRVCVQGACSGFDNVACGFRIADGLWPFQLCRNFNLHHMVLIECLTIDSTFFSSLSSAHLNKLTKKGGWFGHGWSISVKVTCFPWGSLNSINTVWVC